MLRVLAHHLLDAPADAAPRSRVRVPLGRVARRRAPAVRRRSAATNKNGRKRAARIFRASSARPEQDGITRAAYGAQSENSFGGVHTPRGLRGLTPRPPHLHPRPSRVLAHAARRRRTASSPSRRASGGMPPNSNNKKAKSRRKMALASASKAGGTSSRGAPFRLRLAAPRSRPRDRPARDSPTSIVPDTPPRPIPR